MRAINRALREDRRQVSPGDPAQHHGTRYGAAACEQPSAHSGRHVGAVLQREAALWTIPERAELPAGTDEPPGATAQRPQHHQPDRKWRQRGGNGVRASGHP